jgi:H/ACA ribonucleoprotein complex subunit 4
MHVKQVCTTDPRFGGAPGRRSDSEWVRWGVVLLDKPSGPTSRQAAERVARALGAEKVGHGGTLDPKVTGVLPVLLGRSTRVAEVLLGCDKGYEGVMALHGDVDDEALERGMESLHGVIEQMPPRRSAVARRLRERAVYRFEVTGREGRQARFAVDCQGGTYVRKLIHDLGLELGCGAHMASLRRVRAAGFGIEDCVSAEQVAQAAGDPEALRRVVRPVEEVLGRLLPRVEVEDGAVGPLCTGYPLAAPGVCALEDFGVGERVLLLTQKGEVVALGEALMSSHEVLEARHGLAVRMEHVLMEKGRYGQGST